MKFIFFMYIFLFLHLLNTVMNSVDRILNFIDENDNTKETNEEAPKEEITNTEHNEESNNKDTTQTTTEQEPQQKEAAADARDEMKPINKPPMTETQYKGIIRKINNNIKRNRYPCVIEFEDHNMVFPSDYELKYYLNEIKEEHRQILKEERQKNINNYINKNKDSLRRTNKKNYKLNDDEILTTEDNEQRIYKKGPLKAIQREEDIIEIPRTNKKDRKKLYETVKQDKEALKELINSKTDEEFNERTYATLKRIDENTAKIYNIHHNNPFNKDSTWDRHNFIQFLDEMINKEEELRQEAHKRVIRENQQKQTIQENSPYNSYIINQGINPNLMKRY